MDWFIYIVKCSDESFYTGITSSIERRLNQHNFSKVGAKFTHTRRPVILVYQEKVATRSTALRRENEIKKLSREKKEILISDKRL